MSRRRPPFGGGGGGAGWFLPFGGVLLDCLASLGIGANVVFTWRTLFIACSAWLDLVHIEVVSGASRDTTAGGEVRHRGRYRASALRLGVTVIKTLMRGWWWWRFVERFWSGRGDSAICVHGPVRPHLQQKWMWTRLRREDDRFFFEQTSGSVVAAGVESTRSGEHVLVVQLTFNSVEMSRLKILLV